MASSQQTPARRSIVKGAAWSTPVIVAALAAPAAAASTKTSVLAITGHTPFSTLPLWFEDRSITSANNEVVTLPTMVTLINGSQPLQMDLRMIISVSRKVQNPYDHEGAIGRGLCVDSINNVQSKKPLVTRYPMNDSVAYNYPESIYQAERIYLDLQPNEMLTFPIAYSLFGRSNGRMPATAAAFQIVFNFDFYRQGTDIDLLSLVAVEDIAFPEGSNFLQPR